MPDLSMKELAEAIDGVNRGFEEFKTEQSAAIAELKTSATVDPLLEQKLNSLDEAIEEHQQKLDDFFLKQRAREKAMADVNGQEADLDKKAFDFASMAARKRGERFSGDFKHEDLQEYQRVFDRMLRKGDELGLTIEERKALSVGSDVDGGYLVAPDTSGRVVQKLYETSPMRAYASVQTIGTDALEGLYDLDEAGAGWVGETATRSETDTPELQAWRIPVMEMYAKPKATQKLLDDAEINVENWLADKVADKFARTESTAFITGTGVLQPRGILTYDDGTTNPGQINQVDTGVSGGFAADPNGPDALYDAIYGLKAPYLANANFFMNRGTRKLVRKMQDSDGNFMWEPSVQAGQPSMLAGYGVAAFEDMPAAAANSLSVAFGDMREAYQIVDRIGIRVLRDPYSAKPYVEFYTTKRVGGAVLNFEAIILIKFST